MITFADFSAMMAALAQEPAVLLVCCLLGLAAGTCAGYYARGDGPRYPEDEAGDTHTGVGWLLEADALRPGERLVLHRGPPTPVPTPRPRIRAIGGTLHPSYDGRKATPPGA